MSSETISHDEAIGQFCGVTGADEDRARCLLEACDWNLELAINMHVDTDDSARTNKPTITNSLAGSSNSNHADGPSTSKHDETIVIPDSQDEDEDLIADEKNNSTSGTRLPRRLQAVAGGSSALRNSPFNMDSDNVRPPIPPVRQILVQNPASYASDLAPSRRYSSRLGPSSDVYDAFRDFQAEAQWQEREMAQRQSDAELAAVEASDPAASGSSESAALSGALPKRTLQDLYRPPLDLMFRGSIMSAREAATLKNKWLLVNIQNVKEFTCQTLNRDVWSNQAVKELLRENFVFWQMSYDSSEGEKYVQFYNVSYYPHVSILDPRTGEKMRTWPASIDQNSFCHTVIEFLADNPTPDGTGDASTMKKLRVKEEDSARTLYDQSEEAQLEAAIRASLQETESKKPIKVEQVVDEDSSFTDAIESDTEQDYTKYLGCDKERSSDLMVRFPDGTRDQFKLPADSLMKALFLLLASRGYSMNQYNYVTNFPRRNLHEIPESDTLSDAKLVRETIFVEHKNSGGLTQTTKSES